MLYLFTKERLKYACHTDEFNDEMDEIIEEQYNKNKTINIVLSSLSLPLYFLVFILIICLKCAKNGITEGISTTAAPVQVIQGQPIYPQANPVMYPSKNAFQNIMVPPGSY